MEIRRSRKQSFKNPRKKIMNNIHTVNAYTSEFDLKEKVWRKSSFDVYLNPDSKINQENFGYPIFDPIDNTVYAESLISQQDADNLVNQYIRDYKMLERFKD